MDLEFIEKVKKLSIIAMVSDDVLLETLVLKGGNAIDIIYKISGRASMDIDFSIENDFKKNELDSIKTRIERVLQETFGKENLKVFDIMFNERPRKSRNEQADFWGGYEVLFKIIPEEIYKKNPKDVDFLRKSSSVIGPDQKRTFKIDISKFEICTGKEGKDLENYTVYVYTPAMIIFEKIRAICQQLPEYKEIVPTHKGKPRARDFFDIYTIMEHFPVNIEEDNNKELIRIIFNAKRVPLTFLKKIRDKKEFHKLDFSSVQATVKPGTELKDFDFYFDRVVDQFESVIF